MKTSEEKSVRLRDAFWQSEMRISRRLNHPDVEERIIAVDIANKFLCDFEIEMERLDVDAYKVYNDPFCLCMCLTHLNDLIRNLHDTEDELDYYQKRYTRTSHNIRSLEKAADDMDPSALASLLKGQRWSKGVVKRTYPKVRNRCVNLREQILEMEILKCALERGVRRFGISRDRAKAQAS